VGETVALFAFNHQSIVGHPVFVTAVNQLTQLFILAVIAWQLLRISRLLRGVEG